MNPLLDDTKAALRRRMKTELSAMTEAGRAEASARARTLLTSEPVWNSARSVLLFAPLPDELDIGPLLDAALAAGKQVALPRFSVQSGHYVVCRITEPARELARGHFGIREPAAHCAEVPLNRLDLLLIPGIAFDLSGHRLGRGKGYYDRLLLATTGTRCGVAFDQQIVREVPVAPHDTKVNCILTPSRWISL